MTFGQLMIDSVFRETQILRKNRQIQCIVKNTSVNGLLLLNTLKVTIYILVYIKNKKLPKFCFVGCVISH